MTISSVAGKSPDAFRTISEVAESLKLPQHVLRFWETRFTQIKPLKRAGGRRFYRPEDVELLSAIRQLLYGEGYTIKGVQRILREQGPRAVAALAGSLHGDTAATSPLRSVATFNADDDASAEQEATPLIETSSTVVPAETGPSITPAAKSTRLPWEAEPVPEPQPQQNRELDVGAEVEAELRGVMADIDFCRRVLGRSDS